LAIPRPLQPKAAEQGKSSQPNAPQSIRFTQKRTPSTDKDFPFGLQVIVQSDVAVSPISLAIICSSPIGKVNFFIAGQSLYMSVYADVPDPRNHPNIGLVKIGSPALTPASPLLVTFFKE
jgi:hypothetical protein